MASKSSSPVSFPSMNFVSSTNSDITISNSDTSSSKSKEIKSHIHIKPLDPCAKVVELDSDIEEKKKESREYLEDCNETKYMKKNSDGSEQLITLMDLIIYIYENGKSKTTDKIDCDDLLDMFPYTNERGTGKKITGLTKPHIFEALWKIIFILKLDNLYKDNNQHKRIYKKKIESDEIIPGGEFEYLASNESFSQINSGSSTGVCDLCFIAEIKKGEAKKETHREKDSTNCETTKIDEKSKPLEKCAYLFTSKYFKNEKSPNKNYDYNDIAVEAIQKFEKQKEKTPYKIISLVNNGTDLKKKMDKSGETATLSYVATEEKYIYDKYKLSTIYYPALYIWLHHNFKTPKEIKAAKDKEKVWNELFKNVKTVINIKDNLRFHQKYIVEYTNYLAEKQIQETEGSYNPGRYIWGAVARSGKSYMVGGLVAKRNPSVVLLILGAVNETKGQFISELFQTYTDLYEDYDVVDFQDAKNPIDTLEKVPKDIHKDNYKGKKFVVVISQEGLRQKIEHDYCVNNPNIEECDLFYQKNCNKKELEYGKIDDKINCDNHKGKITEGDPMYNAKYANSNKTTKKDYEKLKKKKKTRKATKGKKPDIEDADIEDADIEDADIEDAVEEYTDTPIKYNDSIINIIKEFLKTKEKIVFFDEIHQGSGSNSMQDTTIRFFYDQKISPYYPLFVMVTATYTKPLGRYSNKTYLDNKETKLIEWNYRMIMDMKEFTLDYVTYKVDDKNTPIVTEDSKHLIDITDPDFKDKMNKLNEITLEYNKNGKTCEEIALEYRNYPELIYLLPTLKKDFFKEEQKTPKSIKELFELNKTIPKNPKFVYKEDINSYLDYIYNTVYNELLFQRYKFVANGSGQIHSQLWFMPTTMKGTTKKGQKQIQNPTIEKEDNTIIAPMLSNLAKMIVEHDKFKKFNVCVIHSIKSGIEPGGVYTSEKDTEDPTIIDKTKCRRVYYQCIGNKIDKNKKPDVKKCIIEVENRSRQNGKSLIILTAQRLRLGISLPCVDVAIHMDDIKSYDIIYQSMFRVLTERAGKQRGYFVDMVLDRAIQFFYKYTKAQKHIKMNEEGHMTTKDIIMSLTQFDAGGINSSIYDSTDIVVNSYQEIAEAFKIDTEENFKKYEEELLKNIDDDDIYDKQQIEKQPPFKIVKPPPQLEDIKRQTIKLYNFLKTLYSNPRIKPKLLEKIKNLENTKYSDDEPNNPNTEPGKTEPQNPEPFRGDVIAQPKIPPNQVNKEDKDTSDNELLNNMSKQIKNIFTLIILFGGDDITLEEAINTEQLDYDKIKSLCESDDAEVTGEVDKVMYYCYLIQNHIRHPNPGDVVSKINNEDGNIETGVILKIVNQHICRDISKCFKDGQRIRFTHDRNLIATYNKNENKLVYNGDKYNSLNKLLNRFYEMVDVYSGWNAWSHFEIEISPDNWSSIMELETKPPEIKIISPTSEYVRFLDDIDNNENKCKLKEPKPKEPKAPKQSRKKSDISTPKSEKNINLTKTKRNKKISQIIPIQVLEETTGTIGGATGTPNEEKITYYILWNIDKSVPEMCIETYDETRLQENVIMPKLSAKEIQEIIEKYIGQNGIINFLIEKNCY